jgi:hypothetical protein
MGVICPSRVGPAGRPAVWNLCKLDDNCARLRSIGVSVYIQANALASDVVRFQLAAARGDCDSTAKPWTSKRGRGD